MKRNTILMFVGVISLTLPITSCKEKSNKYEIINNEYYIAKVNEFSEENKLFTSGVDCVFIGDSWTDAYRPLQEYYKEITCLNRGIGGDNSYGLLNRLKVSVYDVNPKVVVMLIGGNNMYDCEKDIKQIIINIKENLPESEIVMQSMYSVSNKEFYSSHSKRLLQLCEYFKKLSAQYDLTYVDLYSPMIDNSGLGVVEYHVEDGVHISSLGYEVITSCLKPVIYDLLAKQENRKN